MYQGVFKRRWSEDYVGRKVNNAPGVNLRRNFAFVRTPSSCQDFALKKQKRKLHDRKTEHFKAITSSCHASAIADHVTSTDHNSKWDHFDILAKGRQIHIAR